MSEEEQVQLTYEEEQAMMAFYAMLDASVQLHGRFIEKNMALYGQSLAGGVLTAPNRAEKKKREKENRTTMKRMRAGVKAWLQKSTQYSQQLRISLEDERKRQFDNYSEFFGQVIERTIAVPSHQRMQLLQMMDLHNSGAFSKMVSEAELERGVEFTSVITPEFTSVINEEP